MTKSPNLKKEDPSASVSISLSPVKNRINESYERTEEKTHRTIDRADVPLPKKRLTKVAQFP